VPGFRGRGGADVGADAEIFGLADEIGPEKVVHFYQPKLQLKAILVVDNTALGPAIGGVRMAPDVSTNEVLRLARSMTLKNAAAGIPYGGGKSAIVGLPDSDNKDELIRTFARLLRSHEDYIPGPDMGTDEHCMAVMHDEIGRAVGLHRVLGGIPLDEIGVTGYGAVEAADVAATFLGKSLRGATVAIEGFGAVGQACFRSLVAKGARVVAVSDRDGCVYNPDGLEFEALVTTDAVTGKVNKLWNRNYTRGERITCDRLFALDVDVLIPGARPDVITRDSVDDVKAWLVVEAANIPCSLEAERTLSDNGALVVPDFVANAGGVIAGSVELRKGTVEESFSVAGRQIRSNTQAMLERATAEGVLPRVAAEQMARDRVMLAMRDKGRL
jgi:glutamate dehydrogenase (NAD(P)+)